MQRRSLTTGPGSLMTQRFATKSFAAIKKWSPSFASVLICCSLSLGSLPALASDGGNVKKAGADKQALPAAPAITSTAAPSTAATATSQTPAPSTGKFLKGSVTQSANPFKEDGSTETLPQGTMLNLTVTANLNSELNNEGDEIRAELAGDLKDADGKKVLLPGKWQVVGKISRVETQKRMGRDGYIEVKFEKLVSPDGKWEVPLDATASTKESTAKTVTKQVATTTGYATVGAVGGSILAVQLTGIGTAIATHGLSVAAGAAVGATLGVVAALRRKGNILCALPGDEIQIKIPAPITIPAFNQDIIPSKAPAAKLKDVDFLVKDFQFKPYTFGDKKSRLLTVHFLVENHSNKPYSFRNIAVQCDHNHPYYPDVLSADWRQAHKSVGANAVQEATLTFQVGSPKLKYSLVLLDQDHLNILSQVPIN